jgi:hypothetical protein
MPGWPVATVTGVWTRWDQTSLAVPDDGRVHALFGTVYVALVGHLVAQVVPTTGGLVILGWSKGGIPTSVPGHQVEVDGGARATAVLDKAGLARPRVTDSTDGALTAMAASTWC